MLCKNRNMVSIKIQKILKSPELYLLYQNSFKISVLSLRTEEYTEFRNWRIQSNINQNVRNVSEP